MDGCTWVILLNFPTLSAFAVSRIDFYSLAKRNFFSRNLICPYCACAHSFREKFFAFRREKAVVDSSLITNLYERVSVDIQNKRSPNCRNHFGLTLFYENPDRQRSRTINAHQPLSYINAHSITFTYMI